MYIYTFSLYCTGILNKLRIGHDEPDMENIEFDQCIDDENFIQEKLSLNNSYTLEPNVDDTPVSFFFFFSIS